MSVLRDGFAAAMVRMEQGNLRKAAQGRDTTKDRGRCLTLNPR